MGIHKLWLSRHLTITAHRLLVLSRALGPFRLVSFAMLPCNQLILGLSLLLDLLANCTVNF